jgi:hypothetical protein
MYPSYETIAAQKAAIIPSSRCINFHLPTCVNLQLPMTISTGRDNWITMRTQLKAKYERFISNLRRKGLRKTAAFFCSLSDLVAAVATGYAALAVVPDQGILEVLKYIVFVLVTAWWAIRFYEAYQEVDTGAPPPV